MISLALQLIANGTNDKMNDAIKTKRVFELANFRIDLDKMDNLWIYEQLFIPQRVGVLFPDKNSNDFKNFGPQFR